MTVLKTLDTSIIRDKIAILCGQANTDLPIDVRQAFNQAINIEKSAIGREVLLRILENADIAYQENIPICQDCGQTIIFIDIGQDVHLTGNNLIEAINEGVRQGYKKFYLRKSICHPFTRINTGDNTPAIIYTNIIPGKQIHIWVMPKGGGSENMSKMFMITPSQGIQGIKNKIIETVESAGPNPCPPIILSIAIGGTFDNACVRAKRGLLRKLDSSNPDSEAAILENELVDLINKTGIGPAGLGGYITCLKVFVDIQPCHIANLPLAINIQCHASRHKEIIL